jgi:hypothetical protein
MVQSRSMSDRITEISEFYESLNRQSLSDRAADQEDYRQHVKRVRARFSDMIDEEWDAAFQLYMKRRLDRIRYVEVFVDDQRSQSAFDDKSGGKTSSDIADMRPAIFAE